jgi:hypothetical protein
MKSIINHLFPGRIKPVYGITIFGLVFFTSCLPQYYKVNTIKKVNADSIQHLVNENRNFILHADQEDFALTQIKVSSDHLDAKAETMPGEYSKFLQANNQKAHRYPAKDRGLVLNTVRLYTSDSVKCNEQISIPFNDFYQLDIYQFNKARTTRAHVGTIVGLTLATAGIVGIVVIASTYTGPYPK